MNGDPDPDIATVEWMEIQTQRSLPWNVRRSRHRDPYRGMDGDRNTKILTVEWTEIQIEIDTVEWTEIQIEILTVEWTEIQTHRFLPWSGRRSRYRDPYRGMDGDPSTEILTVAWTEIQTQRFSPWNGRRSRHRDSYRGMDGDPDRVGAGEGSRHLALVSGVHREGDHTSCREHLGQHHAA